MHHTNNDPDPELEPLLVNRIPAEKTSQHQCDDPHGAVDDPHLCCGEFQSPLRAGVEQKRSDDLQKLSLREPVEEKESKNGNDILLPEKKAEDVKELLSDGFGTVAAGWM